jgi:hypothetical protein
MWASRTVSFSRHYAVCLEGASLFMSNSLLFSFIISYSVIDINWHQRTIFGSTFPSLRHCAISRKVEGSIPDGVIEIYHWRNPSGRTKPLTGKSTRDSSWEERWPLRRADNLATFPCRLSRNSGSLNITAWPSLFKDSFAFTFYLFHFIVHGNALKPCSVIWADVERTKKAPAAHAVSPRHVLVIILRRSHVDAMLSGSLSPRHGVSSGCGWRNGLRYGGYLRINWISSRGQPTKGGPPAWGLGEVLTTLPVKTHVK